MGTGMKSASTESGKKFENQVAGHMNILSSEDDSIIMKPCLTAEREFYEQSPCFPDLLPFLASYMGTLTSAQPEQVSSYESVPTVSTISVVTEIPDAENILFSRTLKNGVESLTTNPKARYICLENLLCTFSKPSVLDLKLGTVLVDHLASEEKKKRMYAKALATTTHDLGIRVTGMKVYDHTTGQYEVYKRDFGVNLNKDTAISAFEKFIPARIPQHIRIELIESFIERLQDFGSVLKTIPARLVASSLLFIYEGDLDVFEEKMVEYQALCAAPSPADSQEDYCSEDLMGPPFDLKLIDFAHSFFLPSEMLPNPYNFPRGVEGPDAGCLLGVSTTLNFLKSLRKQV
ncbi:hypothetical protein DSO57_1000311 [Entomophthora muscae]|uniref:Uncharacterized protein n=1 Tax=Entomophthora muscae TaxID=34485 RepID=A0ACC2TKM2_9FUNG|nr:hypothetical protein DSO57_1000311 [Entomophthora muscae]